MKHSERRQKVEIWKQNRAAIRAVLMSKWDPIGVADTPEAADEYDNYINGVYRLLESGATDWEIAEHLRRIEVDRMGLADLNDNPLLPAEFRAVAVTELRKVHLLS
jgi:hypothetical protein